MLNSQHGSLLHFAARDGDTETLRYLRQSALHDIDLDGRDNDGLTALKRAERRRDGAVEWTDMSANEAPPEPKPLV